MTPTPPLIVYFHGLPGSAAEILNLIPDGVTLPTGISPLDINGFDRALAEAQTDQAHIIGFSLGAMSALKIASQRPDQIRQLTLIAPAAPLELGNFLPAMAGGPVFKIAQKGALPFKLFTAFQNFGVAAAAMPIISKMFAGSPQADIDLLSNDDFKSVFSAGLKASLGRENKIYRKAVLAYVAPWEDCLRHISAPVTIYHGTKDNWAPIEMAYALQTAIASDVKILPLKDLGHYSALHKVIPNILKHQSTKR